MYARCVKDLSLGGRTVPSNRLARFIVSVIFLAPPIIFRTRGVSHVLAFAIDHI